jgi:Kelch motif/Galactose oxidase, central domain
VTPKATVGACLLALAGASGCAERGSDAAPVPRPLTLSVPRAAHSASVLTDGRVLVAGGCTVSSCELDARSASAEVFEPTTNRFTQVGRLAAPRVGQAGAALPDGGALVIGGWHPDGLTRTTERFDPRSKTFHAGPDLLEERGGFTATPLRDGRVLIAGGANGDTRLASAELYDPEKDRFVATGDMTVGRAAHAATRLHDGRVLVVGGSTATGSVVASAEVYNPKTGRFSEVGRMDVARHKHAAVTLRNGLVLVVGGSTAEDYGGRHRSAELFDPRTSRFSPVAPMRERRFKIPDAVVALPAGGALVAGGGTTVEAFDVTTRRFRTVGRVGDELSFATASLLSRGRVLVLGGYDREIEPTAAVTLLRH